MLSITYFRRNTDMQNMLQVHNMLNSSTAYETGRHYLFGKINVRSKSIF